MAISCPPPSAPARSLPQVTVWKWSHRNKEAEMKSFYGVELSSRLMLGTARYPSPAILAEAIRASGASVATVSLRREGTLKAGQEFWRLVRELGVRGVRKTGGCCSVTASV